MANRPPKSPRARAKIEHAANAAAGFLTGQMLIAMPSLTEPPFAGSVIYLCAHNMDGAIGIVINQPLETPDFDELLRQLSITPNPPARRLPLCSGGPVDPARGFVLHSADWTGDGSLHVDASMTLTASRDILQAIATGTGPNQALLALGYAGWEAGQLDRELADNAWLSVPMDKNILFSVAHAQKWRQALALLSIDPLLLSNAAGHA